MLAREQLAWLAGLLEGEGCFYSTPLKATRRFNIQLRMVDRDVVERAGKLMEATVYEKPNGRWASIWEARARGRKAEELAERLLPFMGSRRSEQIQTALAAVAMSRSRAA